MNDVINGKYALETWLGGGSFSDVWKARDIQVPGVVKAIKIYKPTEQTESMGREIMMGEYGIMANTNHPNLLRPDYFDYSHGGKYDGRPYLVLSYCERGNIKQLMGKFTETDAWHLLHDMSSALAYLHRQKPPILHQDIKPENILLGDNGEYLLTDFGVSVKVKPHQDFSDSSVVERAKLSAGTLTYMAPERFQKNQKPILANDVWALGATIYEMLTGYPPFELGGSNQQRGDEIEPIGGKFSKTLSSVIYDMLCQDTAKRPRAEMLEIIASDALRRIGNGLPLDEVEELPEAENEQASKEEEKETDEEPSQQIPVEEEDNKSLGTPERDDTVMLEEDTSEKNTSEKTPEQPAFKEADVTSSTTTEEEQQPELNEVKEPQTEDKPEVNNELTATVFDPGGNANPDNHETQMEPDLDDPYPTFNPYPPTPAVKGMPVWVYFAASFAGLAVGILAAFFA
jgi:serine/threonine protein kinase